MFTVGGRETTMEGLIKNKFANALGYSTMLLKMLGWVFFPPNKKIWHKSIFNYRFRKG